METNQSDAAACGSYPAPDCSTCKHFFCESQVLLKTNFEEVRTGFFKHEILPNTTHDVVVVEECRRFPKFIRRKNRVPCGEYQSNVTGQGTRHLVAGTLDPLVRPLLVFVRIRLLL